MARRNIDHVHLERLQDYFSRHRSIPSYAAIGTLLGFRSKAAVHKLVHRLRKRGYLERTPDGRLAPTRSFFERPVVGCVPAGFASPATELTEDGISIDHYLVEHPASTVLVEVKGDSMIGAGIHAGDFVVVERRQRADPGSIVVAIVDGEFTVKHLDRDAGGYFLRPANPHFGIIRPKASLEIFGVVVGLFRKYPS